MRGIPRLSQQKSDICPQLPSSAQEVIDRYIYVARAMKNVTTDCGRANTPALKIGGDRAAMSINQGLQIWPLRAKQHIPYAAESGDTGNVAAFLVDTSKLRGRGGKSCRGKHATETSKGEPEF
ncbi:uncharacterized protein FMAN_12054 [Fusarium mangiferae]|uniref:Uncharacterized protein n=1 Tax=Fusarium mangiferae TaxID=192010 RepID=A0A1L7UF45_FUSMA|nr:uncharacterized protein FMAN_12054 [Fusarium mangiferae]CVL06963.1 uncharacterized protein FMAN_12054 [Fusarium mangiferae]